MTTTSTTEHRTITHWTEEDNCAQCGCPIDVGQTASSVDNWQTVHCTDGCALRHAARAFDRVLSDPDALGLTWAGTFSGYQPTGN